MTHQKKEQPVPSFDHDVPTKQHREAAFWDTVAEQREAEDSLLQVHLEDGYDRTMPWLDRFDMSDFLEAIIAHIELKPGMKVLDLGCGRGFLSIALALRGANVTGIDISPRSVTAAAHRALISDAGDRCVFRVMDCENLDLPDGSFDAVVGSCVLHHLDLRRAAQEVGRVLRPGGKAAFIESMGLNPVLMAARALLPGRFGIEKASSADEYPLTRRRLAELRRSFDGDLRHIFPQVIFLRMGGYLPFLRSPLAERTLRSIDHGLATVPLCHPLGYFGLIVAEKRRNVP